MSFPIRIKAKIDLFIERLCHFFMTIMKRGLPLRKIKINCLILLFFGVGCASYSPAEKIIRSDKPKPYKYGFLQGCESGHARAGNSDYEFSLNKKHYKKGSQYWRGWRTGYKNCHTLYDSEGRKWEDYPIP
jgi:hypothetical protein